jgi:hypothetical protein
MAGPSKRGMGQGELLKAVPSAVAAETPLIRVNRSPESSKPLVAKAAKPTTGTATGTGNCTVTSLGVAQRRTPACTPRRDV